MLVSMNLYEVVIPVTNDLPARTVVSVSVRAADRKRAARLATREALSLGFGIGSEQRAGRKVTRVRRARRAR